MKVFITYASDDRAAADELAVRLNAEGHDVFIDREDLPHGADYDARIRNAVAACDLYLFLISPHSVKAGRYTLSELGFARSRFPNPSGRVLPVMIAPTPFGDIDPYLKAVTLLQARGNWIAETLAAVEAMHAEHRRQAEDEARRRRRLMLGGGAALAAALIAALLIAQNRRPTPVKPLPQPQPAAQCRLRIESPTAIAPGGLALDVTTAAGTRAYRLTATPLEVELGPKSAPGMRWQLLLRGRDGSALGEAGPFSRCPATQKTIDMGGGHVLLVSPVD